MLTPVERLIVRLADGIRERDQRVGALEAALAKVTKERDAYYAHLCAVQDRKPADGRSGNEEVQA